MGIFSKLLLKAKKDKRILAVALFGSSLSGQGRDIDICLFLSRPFENLEISKIKAEYLSEFNFDINIFSQLPMYIRKRILENSKTLFCRDFNSLYQLCFDFIKEYDFYKKAYTLYLSEVENG